uniref:Uncharacterized protein n=1 Tax=Mimivirus LCMiAC01 TaxID=2506608 RepID=A0A481YZ91_9VIRU|nr:MAG: hypothetical protein LCMiAC01_02490 [Mimivirus LCMiAC01]
MFELNRETIIIIIVLVVILWLLYGRRMEGFDQDTVMFVPVGEPRYGLRGDLLDTRDIRYNYISPVRHIRLHNSNNQMWESDNPPSEEGIKDCGKVPCPINTDEYDKMDTCWKCGKVKQFCACKHPLLDIDIHSH